MLFPLLKTVTGDFNVKVGEDNSEFETLGLGRQGAGCLRNSVSAQEMSQDCVDLTKRNNN